jgi:RNA polymerase sigma-70 factor (ECF subfamily)
MEICAAMTKAPLAGAAFRTGGFAARPSASPTLSARMPPLPLRIGFVVSEGELVGRQPAVTASAGSVSDGELIQRAGTGDRAALETLYERYARSVYGLALRRLGDRGRAEDAVQETFVSIWRAAKTYRPERGPGAPWLYAVARNAIVDRSRVRNEPAVEVSDEPSGESGPDDRAEQAWTQWRVHRALEELPESERDVIALAYWRGLSQSEVAETLGIPLGTVKTRTRSGLQRLAQILDGELR